MSRISKEILELVPKECELCNSERIEYWDQSGEKLIFRCIDCGAYYPIPINVKNLQMDFPF